MRSLLRMRGDDSTRLEGEPPGERGAIVMPCQERHAMPRAPPGRRFATHRVDKLRRRAEVSPSSASSLSVRCRAEVIIAHTPSTLFTYETPTLIVEKSIARLALGSADTSRLLSPSVVTSLPRCHSRGHSFSHQLLLQPFFALTLF